jgi:hypothetical protein
MSVTVTFDTTNLSRFILDSKKKLKDAVIKSANEVAEKVKVKEDSAISSNLDRPTPFTKKAILVRKAYSGRMTAIVQVKDIQADYLSFVIKGQPSSQIKPLVFQKFRNKYGNAPRNLTGKTITRKDLILKKNSKGRTDIVGTWSHRRDYKIMFDFFGIGEKEANRIKVSVFRKNVLLSLVRR